MCWMISSKGHVGWLKKGRIINKQEHKCVPLVVYERKGKIKKRVLLKGKTERDYLEAVKHAAELYYFDLVDIKVNHLVFYKELWRLWEEEYL